MWKWFSAPVASKYDRAVARYRQAPTVTGVIHGTKTVLLDSRSEQFFSLDETGQYIWSLLAIPRNRGEIVAELRQQFAVPEHEIVDDVDAFMASLEHTRLVEKVR